MEQLLCVGIISSVHGVHGEVKIFPTTDDAKRFSKLKKVLVEYRNEKTELHIVSVKFFKQFVICKFQEADRIEEIEQYKGCSLYVTREDAVKLEKDEYFICDLIGLEVLLEDGSHLGILKDVIQTGANDVYVIDSEQYGEILLPAIKDCILKVSVAKGNMEVHLLPGLI